MEKKRKTGASPRGQRQAGRGPRRFQLETVSAHVGVIAVNPAANAVIADTGQMAAGDYRVIANLAASGALGPGKSVVLAHRNAANAADVRILGLVPCGDSGTIRIDRLTMALNERVVARAGSAATVAAEEYFGEIELIAIPA